VVTLSQADQRRSAKDDQAGENPGEVSRTQVGERQEERLVQLVARHVYGEMVGRPVEQVYRVLHSRLCAAEVRPVDGRVRELAAAISDGSYQLLR
jgi:hypothetical protein